MDKYDISVDSRLFIVYKNKETLWAYDCIDSQTWYGGGTPWVEVRERIRSPDLAGPAFLRQRELPWQSME